MKLLLTLSLQVCVISFLHAQGVAIGTNTPNGSALLDLTSTSKGLLPPRMNTAQRTGIASPVKGLLVYDTDLNGLYHYNGSTWASVGGGGGGFSLPYEATVGLNTPAFKITNSGSGPAIQVITTNEYGYGLQASNTTNSGYSVYAYSRSPNGIGVYALADSSIAVKGESGKGIGVDAISTDSTALRARISKGANTDPVVLATHAGAGIALHGISQTGNGVRGVTNTASASVAGVYGENNGTQGSGVYGVANAAASYGVKGESGSGVGVYGISQTGNGVRGVTSTANSSGAAILGVNNGTQGSGVMGTANFAAGYGVQGSSTSGIGVFGSSNDYRGVYGSTISGTALYGYSSEGYGIQTVGKIKFSGGNTNPVAGAVLTSLDASGNAVWAQPAAAPPKVAFRFANISQALTNGVANNEIPDDTYKKVEFYSEEYDIGNNTQVTGNSASSSNTSTFLVPTSGLYHFDAAVKLEEVLVLPNVAIVIRFRLNRNSVFTTMAETELALESTDSPSVLLSTDKLLLPGDKVWVEIKQSNLAFTATDIELNYEHNFFNGHLVFTQ